MNINAHDVAQNVERRKKKISELRQRVLNFNGNIEQSPDYQELARLLVSECIIGDN